MSQINQLDDLFAQALGRLRASLASREASGTASPDQAVLRARVAELEVENAALADELDRLRSKRDKDVAALDDLIAQLKPLIEEV